MGRRGSTADRASPGRRPAMPWVPGPASSGVLVQPGPCPARETAGRARVGVGAGASVIWGAGAAGALPGARDGRTDSDAIAGSVAIRLATVAIVAIAPSRR